MNSRGTLAGSVVLLGLLAAGSYWLAEQARHSDAVTRALGHDIDYTARAITLTRMDETGRAQYVIDAEALVHYADDDSGEFTQPRVVGTRLDRPEMRVRADRGTTTSEGEEVRLYGNVVFNRAAWKGGVALVAKGPFMLLYPEQEILESDQPVQIVQGGSRISANAMRYDNGTHRFQFDGGAGGRVRAVIEPRKAREAQAAAAR